MGFDQRAVKPVEEDQRRPHGRQIELGAAEIGMGLDAAIGDRQRAPVRHQEQFVRIHAVRVEFADATEAVGRIVDADQTARGLEIVLGRVKKPSVRGKDAMAEKMSPGRGLEGHRFGAPVEVEHDGEVPRPPREGDRAPRRPVAGDVVAAIGQGDARVNRAVAADKRDPEPAVAVLVGRREGGLSARPGKRTRRADPGQEPGAGRRQQGAAVEQGRHQSPSSEENPAVSP